MIIIYKLKSIKKYKNIKNEERNQKTHFQLKKPVTQTNISEPYDKKDKIKLLQQ